jgi:hypothetical protein
MRFYERLGFGPTGEHERIARAPDQFQTLLVRHVPQETASDDAANGQAG